MAVVSQIKLVMRRMVVEKCQCIDAAKKFLESVIFRVSFAKCVFEFRTCTGTKEKLNL